MLYQFLNIFFFIFHTAFTLFNIVGWIFPATRKLHLVTMTITALSWFVLGIWYGWGYCVCTDWHWDVRAKLGLTDRSNSYIHFLLYKLTGSNLDPKLVENATLIIFLLSFALAIAFYIRDRRRKKYPS